MIVFILVKTGSIGKVFKFMLRYAFYPVLFALLFGLVVSMVLGAEIGLIAAAIGSIVGLVKVFKDTKKDVDRG